MPVEDTTAFIEQLEVQIRNKRAEKHRRRVAQAEIEVLEVMAEIRLANEALREMDQAAERTDREIEDGRIHLKAKREELDRKRERVKRLAQKSRDLEARGRKVKLFRLHSAQHYVDCSERRFASMLGSQSTSPMLVSRSDGRRWWWYRDRFWWDDSKLTPDEFKTAIQASDLDRSLHHHLLGEARAHALGTVTASNSGEPLPDRVRRAVWRRDRGRCVDCGTVDGLGFERIIPGTIGVSVTPDDFALCCRTCCVLRAQPGSGSRAWDPAEV